MKVKRTILIAKIPEDRFRSFDESILAVDDAVVLDQAFTFKFAVGNLDLVPYSFFDLSFVFLTRTIIQQNRSLPLNGP